MTYGYIINSYARMYNFFFSLKLHSFIDVAPEVPSVDGLENLHQRNGINLEEKLMTRLCNEM